MITKQSILVFSIISLNIIVLPEACIIVDEETPQRMILHPSQPLSSHPRIAILIGVVKARILLLTSLVLVDLLLL